MAAYLAQIADRGNAPVASNGIIPASKHYMAAETPLYDPFEQTISEQSTNAPASEQPGQQEIVRPVKEPGPDSFIRQTIQNEPARETGYLTRHVLRVTEKEQKIITSKDITVPVDQTASVINPYTPGQKKVSNETAAQSFKDTIQTANDEKKEEPSPAMKLFKPQQEQRPVKSDRRQSIQERDASAVLPLAQLAPVLPVAQAEKQKIKKEKPAAAPQLVIGRITVQVLPPEKPQVIHKVEKRTIVASKPAASQVHSKFIFGLGQL